MYTLSLCLLLHVVLLEDRGCFKKKELRINS
jgi:hypothetical protein